MSIQVQCRKCKKEFEPSFSFDFYQDDKEGPGTGLCERCMMNEAFNPPALELPGGEQRAIEVCKRGCGRETCIFLSFSGAWEGAGIWKCLKSTGLNNSLIEKARTGKMGARMIRCDGGQHGRNWELKEPPLDLDEVARKEKERIINGGRL